MQLFQNRIAIRERSFLDILDLALRVIRAHAKPLFVFFLIGVVPAVCFNAWVLADYAEPDFELGEVGTQLLSLILWGIPVRPEVPATYMAAMLVLILWEIPLVTAGMTKYLGHALFAERPDMRVMRRELLGVLPQLLWYQVLWRSISLAVLISGPLLLVSVPVWIILFGVWPFFNEVILLERNPMFAGRKKRMTTRRRVRDLHKLYQSELFFRSIMTAIAGAGLFGAVWFSSVILQGLLVYDWEFTGIVFMVFYPLAVWAVVGYLTVVRFLGYLDLRIRQEGWEVELMMRAEEAQLARQLT